MDDNGSVFFPAAYLDYLHLCVTCLAHRCWVIMGLMSERVIEGNKRVLVRSRDAALLREEEKGEEQEERRRNRVSRSWRIRNRKGGGGDAVLLLIA